MNYVDPKLQARQTQIVEVLEMVCESLELSNSQFAQAKQRYEGVGACLAGSDDPVLRAITIYLQGSTALRTTVKPIGVNEHDVDLVAHVPDLDVEISPAALKKAIGDCLRANGNYAPLLEEMPRCWRLNYANEFHLDITPSIPNPDCRFGGELVPDKTLKDVEGLEPEGLQAAVRGARQARSGHPPPQARRRLTARGRASSRIRRPAASRASCAARCRSRSATATSCSSTTPDLAPLSVIITTLASRSYEWCVTNREYDNELELLFDVIRHMPDTIEIRHVDGSDAVVHLERNHRRRELRREVESPAGARRSVLHAWHARFCADLGRSSKPSAASTAWATC